MLLDDTRQGSRWIPVALVVLYAALLASWSMVVPQLRGPDEAAHVDLAFETLSGSYPPPGEARLSERIVAARDLALARERQGRLYASAATTRSERPRWSQLPEGDNWRRNQLTQHPPLYYVLMAPAAFLAPRLGDPPAWDEITADLRLWNVALIAPLPLLLLWGARVLSGGDPDVAVTAALVPLWVPRFTENAAYVNNDTVLVLAFAGLTPLIIRIARGEWSRNSLLAGAATGIALLTKGFALVAPMWLAVAFAMGWRRATVASKFRHAFIAGAAAMIIGGWWWLLNLLRYGAVQPDGMVPIPGGERSDISLIAFLGRVITRLFDGLWWSPQFGQAPRFLIALTAVTCVAAIVVAVAHRRSPVSLPMAVTLTFPMATLAAIVVYRKARRFLRFHDLNYRFVQGRYLFAAIPALALLVAAGLVAIARQRRAMVPVMAVIATLVIQLIGLYSAVRRTWGRPRVGFSARIEAFSRWSPIDPAWLVGALALALLALGVLAMFQVRRVRRAGVLVA